MDFSLAYTWFFGEFYFTEEARQAVFKSNGAYQELLEDPEVQRLFAKLGPDGKKNLRLPPIFCQIKSCLTGLVPLVNKFHNFLGAALTPPQ